MEGLGGNRGSGRDGMTVRHLCSHSGVAAELEQEAIGASQGQDAKELLKRYSATLVTMEQCGLNARRKDDVLDCEGGLIPMKLPRSSLM